jgi:redox-sensitive bicupin YhaK (pirin superfamily)
MEKQRGIRRIKTVQYQRQSPTHKNGFVMNTQEEIRQAIIDYQTGKFKE